MYFLWNLLCLKFLGIVFILLLLFYIFCHSQIFGVLQIPLIAALNIQSSIFENHRKELPYWLQCVSNRWFNSPWLHPSGLLLSVSFVMPFSECDRLLDGSSENCWPPYSPSAPPLLASHDGFDTPTFCTASVIPPGMRRQKKQHGKTQGKAYRKSQQAYCSLLPWGQPSEVAHSSALV